MSAAPRPTVAEVAHALAGRHGADRTAWLARHPEAWTPELLVRLADEVTAQTQVDLSQAEAWLTTVQWLAMRVTSQRARARAARAAGHVASLRGRYRVALRRYQQALDGFRRAREPLEAAITRSGALQTLIYLGRYRDALGWASRARRVFLARRDDLRLARLETNVGNILHRHDRFEEALERYQAALDAFVRGHHRRDEAIVLRNMAVCYIGLTRFEPAIATYERARQCALQQGLHGLVPKIDYNIAYLHYLRGDYELALRLFEEARARCEAAPDPYHAALCDLDQAELALELNLLDEGAALALSARDRFADLGLVYERAKAIVNMGVAAQRTGNWREATQHYRRARTLFAREGNHVWMALLDQYAAFALVEAGRIAQATPLARAALNRFGRLPFEDRSALAWFVWARIQLAQGRVADARAACERALAHLAHHPVPAISYRVWHLLGRIEQAAGRETWAARALGRAHVQVEAMRGHLGQDSLKVAFLQDKLAVYESLVRVTLAGRAPKLERAFRFMQQAKSRALVEQLSARAGEASVKGTGGSRHLRELLAARYRHRDALLETPARATDRSQRLRAVEAEIQELEQRLHRARAGAPSGDLALTLADVQGALGAGTVVVEYYVAEGQLLAWVISRRQVSVHTLGPDGPVLQAVRFLQFQLSAHRWREARKGTDHALATRGHLAELHRMLVEPLASQLARADHVIFAPHGALHAVPFAALNDGANVLVERMVCSSTPSAAALVGALRQPPSAAGATLVLGVPDPLAPSIATEVERVAECFRAPVVLTGVAATAGRFAEAAGHARVLHLATHGHFRADNPLFSSIRLVDAHVTLQDLDRLRLDADLVAMSGCGTGRGVVVGGDELMGLSRGLLRAGARSLLVSLWDVHDATTTALVTQFYDALRRGQGRAEALREAALAVRQHHPHPFYWAPFALVGDHRPLDAPIFSSADRHPFSGERRERRHNQRAQTPAGPSDETSSSVRVG